MPDSSPPSFDAIFEHQRRISASDHNRQSSSSSSNMSVPSTSYGRPFTNGQPMSDEPPPLDGRASNASPFNPARERASSSASSVRHPQNPESRQDSLPWSSTIINTAGQGEQPQASGQWFDPSPLGYAQYGDDSVYTWPQNGDFAAQGSPYLNNSSPAGNYMSPGSGYASTPASTGVTPGMGGFDLGPGGYTPGAESGHVKRESFDGGMYNGGTYQGGLGGNGNGQQGGSDSRTSSGEDNVKMEDFMEDLLQTLSRSVSREPSPNFQGDQYFLQQQQNALQPFTSEASPLNHISPGGSRPVSPFETAPSPSFASASISRPSGSSPSFNKPQSPPALNMPNAPSPVTLPPIVTQQSSQATSGSSGQGHALANQMGGMGGLLPPTNPALQHLTGMMGISPIAPNADGPQIFVQPSTPISGLKDGRGHFDAALRRAAQQAQQNRQSQNGDDSAQQQQFSVPSPNMGNGGSPQPNHQTQAYQQNAMDFATRMQMQAASGWGDLGSQLPSQRPRAKSDSFAPVAGGLGGADFERQAVAQILAQAQAMGFDTSMGQVQELSQQGAVGSSDWRDNVGAWLSSMGLGGQGQAQAPFASASGFGGGGSGAPPGTVNPNQLPGNDQDEFLRQLEQQHQLSQLQAQRAKMNPLSVNTQTNSSSGIFKYEPGEFSPTSMAFYQQRGMLPPSTQFGFAPNTAPLSYAAYPLGIEQYQIPDMPPGTAPLPQQSRQAYEYGVGWLATPHAGSGRRSSFQEGSSSHHATGAGTPGYGMGFERGQGAFGSQPQGLSGRVRGVSPNQGHRRAAKSEDFGRGGWGLGHGGSTTEFLNSITANDGSLIPPLRGGRTHSRQSSVSSNRSASPALSVSSYDSSFSHASGSGHGHMDMPDGTELGGSPGQASASGSGTGAAKPGGRARLSKMKVTSMATEVAATNRRTNNGIFQCPVPGCGSTFTRHFNLKGHMRSHNDERPYKCLYDGCPKGTLSCLVASAEADIPAEVGFARQHDCKRHMLLHQGLRPFECEACHKKFARLDALTRHHKSEQGIECAIACPLPINPDGSAMSESQYKNFKAAQELLAPTPAGGAGKKGRKRAGSGSSAGGRSGDESAGGGSGMEDYDRV